MCITTLHQLSHYTNDSILYNLCNSDNIVNCDTYREYILRVSMVMLTQMSVNVISYCRYLELCKDQNISCLIELIRFGCLELVDYSCIKEVITNLMNIGKMIVELCTLLGDCVFIYALMILNVTIFYC